MAHPMLVGAASLSFFIACCRILLRESIARWNSFCALITRYQLSTGTLKRCSCHRSFLLAKSTRCIKLLQLRCRAVIGGWFGVGWRPCIGCSPCMTTRCFAAVCIMEQIACRTRVYHVSWLFEAFPHLMSWLKQATGEQSIDTHAHAVLSQLVSLLVMLLSMQQARA